MSYSFSLTLIRPSNFPSQRTSCTWWITLCWTFPNQFASRKTKHGSGPYAQRSMSEIQYGYNCGDRQVSTSVTRKHSSRMLTARLPTVRVVVATTRCQYWGRYARSHVGGGRYTHPPLPLHIPTPSRHTPVHATLPWIYPPGHTHPHPEGTWDQAYLPHPQKGPRT